MALDSVTLDTEDLEKDENMNFAFAISGNTKFYYNNSINITKNDEYNTNYYNYDDTAFFYVLSYTFPEGVTTLDDALANSTFEGLEEQLGEGNPWVNPSVEVPATQLNFNWF